MMSTAGEAAGDDGPYHALTVKRIITETDDAISVILDVPDDLEALFAYRAGQFLTFHVSVDGHHLARCYSLASSPDAEAEHKVTVKRVESGRVSNWLHDHLREGERLKVMKPAGHFVLADRAGPIVLFAGGSGITPVISIVKSALATSQRGIRLVYANRDAGSIIFGAELERLVSEHPERLEVLHRLDDVDGFLDIPTARSLVADRPDADFYVCGPAPYMDVVEAALSEQGVAAEHIFIERFVIEEQNAAAGAAAPAVATGDGIQVEIYLDGDLHTVACEPGETILKAAHRAGLDAPCACVEGYCGACMAKLETGEAEMILNDGGLEKHEEEQGWVLTCQAVPKSTRVRVDYPDSD